MMTAVALDDEPIALEVVKSLAEKVPFLELKACFTDAFQAIDYLQNNKVDILLLDIKMPDISGLELLKSLTQPPLVIFTTAYAEHAVQSFGSGCHRLLAQAPFSLSRFLKACNKAHETRPAIPQQQRLLVPRDLCKKRLRTSPRFSPGYFICRKRR